MAEITAAMVKELREMTGAGMMDCKKALNETGGNMDEAVEVLRKSGQAKAVKKEGRIAAEGICRIATRGDEVAAVAEQAVATESADMDAFLAEQWNAEPGKTVQEALVDKIAVIGEKLSIRRFEKVVAKDGCVVSYVHGGGRIGVIVEAETKVVNDAVKEALTNLAMQVAALNPKYVATEEVSEEFKTHEREIIAAQIEQDPKMAGKPENVIAGAIEGRLKKELKEVCLLEQVYVKAEDGKQTVSQYVAQVSKENGTDLKIKRFVRFETGEGLEKKNEDFAAEVAAQMGQ